MLTNKTVLVTGGTGSLGKVLTRRLLAGELGTPKKIIIFSRDEAKQHFMRVSYMQKHAATDEIIYQNASQMLQFVIGDVRDFHSVASVLQDVDVVFNTAALKQVPTCEYFPYQSVMTNISGPENIVRAIQELNLPIEAVMGISTDKACKPVNVMGMSKAIQERVFIQANMRCPKTRFTCVRYGNVLASRGSVIPLFHDQIRNGGPVTVTDERMTRFLLSLDRAVDTIFAAYTNGCRGETFIPRVPSANMLDLAEVLIDNRDIDVKVSGIRPGEKLHEILVSEEEINRTFERGDYYVIAPILPEIKEFDYGNELPLLDEYSSGSNVMTREELHDLIARFKLMVGDHEVANGELLR